MLYTLYLHGVICQIYFNKMAFLKIQKERKSLNHFIYFEKCHHTYEKLPVLNLAE